MNGVRMGRFLSINNPIYSAMESSRICFALIKHMKCSGEGKKVLQKKIEWISFVNQVKWIVVRWRRPRRMSAENPINARSESILMCASHASLSLCLNRKFCDCIYAANGANWNADVPLNVEWRASNTYYSNRMCVCVYECSVLIILCARAHLILFLLLARIDG